MDEQLGFVKKNYFNRKYLSLRLKVLINYMSGGKCDLTED